jgi:hypothetical protein
VNRRALLVPFVFLLLCSSALAQTPKQGVAPSAAELLADVTALTAPEMEGRGSGTAGAERAARYIADRLKALGLRPGGEGGSFFQPFTSSTTAAVGPNSVLEMLGSPGKVFRAGTDWMPHGGSLAEEVKGEIVFAGYGSPPPTGATTTGRVSMSAARLCCCSMAVPLIFPTSSYRDSRRSSRRADAGRARC